MPALNLNPILSQVSKTNQSIDTATSQLVDVYKSQQAGYDANAAIISAMGSNAVIIESAKQSADLATQQARLKAANNLGTNYRDQGEVLSSLSETISTEYAKKDQALQAIEAKQSVSFFDDPLSWISNQFTINDDIDKHNAADARLTAAQDQMQKLNTLTQSTIVTQNQLNESVTAASIKATTDNLALKAQADANLQKIQGQVYNADAIKAALSADKEKLQNTFSVFSAQKQEQQVEIALAHLALSREEFSWKQEEKNKGKQEDSYLLEQINAGRKLRMGDQADLILPGSTRAGTVLSLLKSNSPAGKEFQDDYMIAQQSQVSGTRMLAPSAAKAIELLNSGVPVKLVPAQESVKGVLNSALSQIQDQIAKGTLDPKNRDAVNSALNKAAKGIVDSQGAKVVPGDADNIFNIPSVNTLIANSPTLQKLPVVQKVIAPLVATGADLTDPNKVMGALTDAIKSGKISYSDALEATSIYQVGVRSNMEAKQLTSLGITPKWSYNVSVRTDPEAVFGGTEVVDLTKPDALGRALNKSMSRTAFRESVYNLNPFNTGVDVGQALKGTDIPPNTGFPMYMPKK